MRTYALVIVDINSEQVMVLPSGARVTIDGYRVQTRTVTYWDGSTATIGSSARGIQSYSMGSS